MLMFRRHIKTSLVTNIGTWGVQKKLHFFAMEINSSKGSYFSLHHIATCHSKIFWATWLANYQLRLLSLMECVKYTRHLVEDASGILNTYKMARSMYVLDLSLLRRWTMELRVWIPGRMVSTLTFLLFKLECDALIIIISSLLDKSRIL